MLQDFWVFGYGSLMWNPGFCYEEARTARLFGWRRSMCILSTHYRGKPGTPGLVLGLDRGGSCYGLAFRVSGRNAEETRAFLHEREMLGNVYIPREGVLRLDDGRRVPGSFYTARRTSPSYAGALSPEQAAVLIRRGSGSRGTSRDYLANTVAQLERLSVADGALARLLSLVDRK
ncbi:MAG: gamma-glutamylcyclotransferase [Rhodospirillaceae bacterium]|nr:gamma-glutamylcyclotransferase [Rhodospirillaceae bacterium]